MINYMNIINVGVLYIMCIYFVRKVHCNLLCFHQTTIIHKHILFLTYILCIHMYCMYMCTTCMRITSSRGYHCQSHENN